MRITHIIGFSLTMTLTACSGKESTPREMPVVAHIENVNGEPLTVCQLDLLTDTVDIPLIPKHLRCTDRRKTRTHLPFAVDNQPNLGI